jgi:hypothetical protein
VQGNEGFDALHRQAAHRGDDVEDQPPNQRFFAPKAVQQGTLEQLTHRNAHEKARQRQRHLFPVRVQTLRNGRKSRQV